MSTATTTKPIRGPMPDTPEWHEAHLNTVTATDWAKMLNVSDYGQPLDVYLRCRKLVEPFGGNKYTRLGKRAEGMILDEYGDAEGVTVTRPLPLYYHATIPYLAATPDAEVADDGRLVEAKWTLSPKRAAELGEEHTDWIPDDWLTQMQGQMDVMQRERCDVAVFLFGRLRVYIVYRNDQIIDAAHAAAEELWQRIQSGDPPAPNWQHPKTPELVKSMFGVEDGTAMILPADAVQEWDTYRRLGDRIKELEAEREAAKAKVLYAMGTAAIGELGDGRQLCRSVVSRKEYVCKACSFTQLRERKAR